MDVQQQIEYLKKIKFQKRLDKLIKKYKDKKIIIYGAGSFFNTICSNYDLSDLNIVGVSDAKFTKHEPDETYQGYKIYSVSEIENVKPDYVLVGTLNFINIIEDLENCTLKDTTIKIRPLIKKPLKEILSEIWS